MTIDHDRFAEANQPPPEGVAEVPEAETAPEAKPEQESYGERLRAIVRSETEGLVGNGDDDDWRAVEASVTAALSEAFAPYGFTAEWRADRSLALDELGTLFGVMRIEPRRAK